MLNLTLQRQTAPMTILCLGAHSDDIEIGCGGTILTLLGQYARARVYWVVLSSDAQRAQEAQHSASKFLERAHSKTIITKEFKNSFFPSVAADIKGYFEQLKQDVNPDLILTHYRDDFHQDHRIVSEFTWNTFRNHMILEYEIPKYDGDFGSPNMFVHLDEATAKKKAALIMDSFPSQRDKHWFDENTFMAVLRLRGMESLAPHKYAEGFYCRKAVLR